jgi:NADH-quinone oxidoreductase subunit M
VKMGLFGLIKWVWPVVPSAVHQWGDVVMSFALIGVIYASIIAIMQDDLKRLVAYSSIAHIGLMVMAIFAENKMGAQGVMMQMFNHGVNIIGLWIVIELIERQFGTRKLSHLGGIAQKAPGLTTLLVIIAFANISLPLTNAFVGEFLIFNGIWNSISQYKIVFAAVSGLSIILAAAYTLRMIQRVFYGATNTLTEAAHDIRINERVALGIVVLIILVFGVYPQPLLDMTNGFVDNLLLETGLKKPDVANLTIK